MKYEHKFDLYQGVFFSYRGRQLLGQVTAIHLHQPLDKCKGKAIVRYSVRFSENQDEFSLESFDESELYETILELVEKTTGDENG